MIIFSTAVSLPVLYADTLQVGPGQTYTTVQSAVDAATAGDTIQVNSDTYTENVQVDKQLILLGVGDPIIDADEASYAIQITSAANGCTIQGFQITNAPWNPGIEIQSTGNTVTQNQITYCWDGISVTGGSNEIYENQISYIYEHGISIQSSNGNIVHHNTITEYIGGEWGWGIYIHSSSSNIIHHNDLDYTGETGTYNAWDTSDTNTWYDTTTSEGNRYSDYSGVDESPEDGIGDTSYTIMPEVTFDPYPLMPIPPATAPEISVGSISESSLTSTSITISWSTNQATSDNRLEYGLESDLSDAVWTDWEESTNAPSIPLSGLTPETTYYYRCYAYNGDDHDQYDSSTILSFTTIRAPITLTVDDDLVEWPDADYTVIQDAIDAAIDDDTVQVYPGTYFENLIFEKRLNLIGINYPNIEGNGVDAVHIKAKGCLIDGFNITGRNGFVDGNGIRIGYGDLIFKVDCGETTIQNCHIHRSQDGIYVDRNSHDNDFINNNIRRNGQAIYFLNSDSNTITDCTVAKNGKGIVFMSSDHNTITGGFFLNNSMLSAVRMDVEYPQLGDICEGNRIEYSKFFNDEVWVGVSVTDTVITRNYFRGRYRLIHTNYDAISLHLNSENIEISHNTIAGRIVLPMGDHSGILVDSAKQVTLTNNTVRKMFRGISLINANKVTMRDNTLYDNAYNFHIDTYPAAAQPIKYKWFNHDIDTSNTLDGLELHYQQNVTDLTFNQLTTPNIGYLACINADNINVENLVLSDNGQGILFYNVDNSLIDTVFTWDNHLAGISLIECQNVEVTDASMKNNGDDESYGTDFSCTGILVLRGGSHDIHDCDISNNERRGVKLVYTDNNHLHDNDILDNGRVQIIEGTSGIGITIRGPSTGNQINTNTIKGETFDRQRYGIWMESTTTGNTIYDNYFENTINAFDLGGQENWNIAKTLGTNIIDGVYLGGNFWSDYTGGDLDFDGIGDTEVPYTADGDITVGGDDLPLTDTWIDDGVPPTIVLTHPTEGITVSDSWVTIQVSSPDIDVDEWWYSIDGGPEVIFVPGEPSSTIYGLTETSHTLIIYVDDVFDNQNSEEVTFNVQFPQPEPPSPSGPSEPPSPPPLSPISEEEAEFTIVIVTPEPIGYKERELDIVIDSPLPLSKASYRVDGGSTMKLTGSSKLSRLTQGEHFLEVFGRTPSGLKGRGEVTFTVIPFELGEVNETGSPEYMDDVSFAFYGRDTDYVLTFEASQIARDELDIYVNKRLEGEVGVDTDTVNHPSEGIFLSTVPESSDWTQYSIPVSGENIVSTRENIVSFIHTVNPERALTRSWKIRDVRLVPAETTQFPQIEVDCIQKALTPGDSLETLLKVSGVLNHTEYDLYIYALTPEGETLYYPNWDPSPQPLPGYYLKNNYYGRIPVGLRLDENSSLGTYRMVGKITQKGRMAPVALASDLAWFSNTSTIKLYINSDTVTDGSPITIKYSLTHTGEPMNGSMLISMETPSEEKIYYPQKTSYITTTTWEHLTTNHATILEDEIDDSWENGTYVVRASLFDENNTFLDDDLVIFDVCREHGYVTGIFTLYNVTDSIVYSKISLYDARSQRIIDTQIQTGVHSYYWFQAPPGEYILVGMVATDGGLYHSIPATYFKLPCGEGVRNDFTFMNSPGPIELETLGVTNLIATEQPISHNLLYNDVEKPSISSALFTRTTNDGLFKLIQDQDQTCPKPKVFVSANISPPVLEDLIAEFPGDTEATLKRYFTSRLVNLLKASSPGVEIHSYNEVLDGMGQIEQQLLLGGDPDLSSIRSMLGAEYLVSLSLGKVGEQPLVSCALLDVDLVTSVKRESVESTPQLGIPVIANAFNDLGDIIRNWETSHPAPPRGPRIDVQLSKESVSPENGENTLTMSATVTNCRGEPVKGVKVFFSNAGRAISGTVPRGRVEAEGERISYVYAVTDENGVAQAQYTLFRGINPDNEEINTYVVGRGGLKASHLVRFKLNGIGIRAWAEKGDLAPLESTIVHVKLFKVEDGQETPLPGRKVFFDDSDIKDSILVPLGATENGLLVTDNNGEATLKFVAGEKDGQIGILFRYNLELDDPQFPGFRTGDYVVDKAIIEIKFEKFKVFISWTESYSENYHWARKGYYEGNNQIDYSFRMSSETIWDRMGGKEDSKGYLNFNLDGNRYLQLISVWSHCYDYGPDPLAPHFTVCLDGVVKAKYDTSTLVTDCGISAKYYDTTVNTILKKDALDNIYVHINPIKERFPLEGAYDAHEDWHWEEYDIRTEGGEYDKSLVDSDAGTNDWHHDYTHSYTPRTGEKADAVMYYQNPHLRSWPDLWYGPGFDRNLVKLKKTGKTTYEPYINNYDNAFQEEFRPFGGWGKVEGTKKYSRNFSIRVVKK